MNREAAFELVREKTEKDTTVRHLISVQGIMRRLGAHLGEDDDLWALGQRHEGVLGSQEAEGQGVRKKLKDKAFAPGVARDDIHSVQEGIGLELDAFIALSIEGLQQVAPEIGL